MATSTPRRTARTVYRALVGRGLDRTSAGNLAAWLVGLKRADDGWTPEAIEELLFVAWLVRSGRLTGDTLPPDSQSPWAHLWT